MSNEAVTAEQVKTIMQMHEESILRFVKMNFELVTTRIDSLTKEVQDIKYSINFTDEDNDEKITGISKKIKEVKASVSTLVENYVQNANEVKIEKEKPVEAEQYPSRRHSGKSK